MSFRNESISQTFWDDLKVLGRSFVIAMDLRKLFLGFSGILVWLVIAGGLTWGLANFSAKNLYTEKTENADGSFTVRSYNVEVPCLPSGHPLELLNGASLPIVGKAFDSEFEERLGLASGEQNYFLHKVYFGTFHQWWSIIKGGSKALYGFYLFALLLLTCAIWGYFGGAICRIAAVETATEDRIDLGSARKFARKKFLGLFMAPVIPGVFWGAIVLIMAAVAAGIGIIPYAGDIVLPFLLPFAIIGGLLVALIKFGLMFGAPLFLPAIGAEGTDSFDAISRGYSYVYSRPLTYFIYQAVNWVFGCLAIYFIWNMGFWALTHTLDAAGMFWPEGWATFSKAMVATPAADVRATVGIGGIIAAAILWVVAGVIFSYAISYFFSCQTVTYFLLRKRIDGIDIDEVYEDGNRTDFWEEELNASKDAADQAAPPAPAKNEEKADDAKEEAPKEEASSDDASEEEEKPKKKSSKKKSGGKKKKSDGDDE